MNYSFFIFKNGISKIFRKNTNRTKVMTLTVLDFPDCREFHILDLQLYFLDDFSIHYSFIILIIRISRLSEIANASLTILYFNC